MAWWDGVLSWLGNFLMGGVHTMLNPYFGPFQSFIGGSGGEPSGIGQFLWQIGQIFFVIAVTIAPFLPVLLLAYFLDVAITSIQKGTIQPVGNFAYQIYDVAVTLVEGVEGILGYIIPFIMG